MTRGDDPPNPPRRFAPTRWYFADTPTALTPSGGTAPRTPRYPLRYARITGRSPGPLARGRWAGMGASP